MKRKSRLPVQTSMMLVALCLVLSIMGCGEPAFESLDDSFIAFVRNDQIWTANADGSEQKQLTQGWDAAPAVSPDGKTIVYTHSSPKEKDLDSSESGSNPEQVNHGTTWNPHYAAIYKIPSGGGDPARLTPESWLTDSGWTPLFPNEGRRMPGRVCKYPSYSPNGESICFVVNEYSPETGSSYAVATINADAPGEPEILYRNDPISADGPSIYFPRYSPDGNDILFALGVTLHRLSVKGGTPSKVIGGNNAHFGCGYSIRNSDGTVASSSPMKSPDAFDPLRKILLMDLENNNRRLTNSRAIYTAPMKPSGELPDISREPPTFSPSGKTIAFHGYFPTGGPKIFIIRATGGKPKEVISNGYQPCFGKKPSGQ